LLLHALLYALLCAAPALILLPLRYLDRPPSNEIRHESGDDTEGDRDGPVLLRAA
jgi:hypothetical protein